MCQHIDTETFSKWFGLNVINASVPIAKKHYREIESENKNY